MQIQKTKNGFQLRDEICVKQTRSQVFEFYSDAYQLGNLTPPFLNFSVVTPGPIEMKVGTIIDYKLKIHGVSLNWKSKISVWEPDSKFVDEQVKGPYKRWCHEHIFEDHEGGTRIIDVVTYDVPFAFLVHPFFVKPDLNKIFSYRSMKVPELLDKQYP